MGFSKKYLYFCPPWQSKTMPSEYCGIRELELDDIFLMGRIFAHCTVLKLASGARAFCKLRMTSPLLNAPYKKTDVPRAQSRASAAIMAASSGSSAEAIPRTINKSAGRTNMSEKNTHFVISAFKPDIIFCLFFSFKCGYSNLKVLFLFRKAGLCPCICVRTACR